MQDSSTRRVKIVCTLGPSSDSLERITSLLQAGMDVARLNFSHGDHAFHKRIFDTVRQASQNQEKLVAVMQDLQGPKIRVGKLPAAGIQLKAGDVLLLHPEGADPKFSTQGRIPLPIMAEIADPIARSLSKGARILFDDGKISAIVKEVKAPEIVAEIIVGGKLTSHKGMNLPGTPLAIPCCTEKDLEDLKLGLSLGVDAVALSFVRSPEDVEFVKKLIEKQSNHRPLVISKVEREEAILAQEGVIEVSDGLLVARGDMAVEIGVDRVPIVQKRLIHACNELGVPIITATQMLESMISSPTPTRAEASDVANAVFDGTDAVMLSGETASGSYPIEAVNTMAQVILEAERSAVEFTTHRAVQPMPGSIVDSVEFSASRIAQHVGAVAIACLTHSGTAARALAKYRPDTPIVAIMDSESSIRKLAPVWGVRGVLIPKIVGTDDLFAMVDKVLTSSGWASDGDLVVVTAGVPTLRRGTTNMIKVHKVGAPLERAARKS